MASNNGKNAKLIKKAINKHKSGKLGEARSLYKKILASDSKNLDANYLLGTLLAEQGELAQALPFLKQAEVIEPRSHRIKNNLGNVYRLLGEYEQACQYYEQALSLETNMPEAYNNLAIIYRRLGDTDRAMDYYERALACNPMFQEAIYNLGKLYWDLDRKEDARACYHRVLDVNERFAPAHHDLGMYYMQQGETDKAVAAFNRYLALAPQDDFGARLKLAYLAKGELPDRQPDQLVRETYEKKAPSWDQDVNSPAKQFLGPQHIKEAVEKTLPGRTGLNVLDLGCGTGLCGEFLKSMSKVLHGVDLSSHMLELARNKGLYDELFNTDLESYLKEFQQHYDLITASGVLIFYGDLKEIFHSISLIMNKDGLFISTFYQSEVGDVSIRDNIHFAHSENHIKDAAVKSGLSVEAINPIIHEYENNQPQPGFLVILGKQ